MTIGERLRSLRGKQSLAELGKDLDVSATQLSKIETDQSRPSFELAEKICVKYGVTLDWLMRGIVSTGIETFTYKEVEGNRDLIVVSKIDYIELQRKLLDLQGEELEELKRRLKS